LNEKYEMFGAQLKTFLPIFKVVFRKKIYIFGKIVMFFEEIIGNAGEF
jgi:hypothetical protein